MIAQVEQADGSYIKKDVELECGVHFCDECGDCLVCYGEDPCYPDGDHSFVIYYKEVS